MTQQPAVGRGTALMLASAVGFAALYFVTPALTPLSPVIITALRIVMGAVSLVAYFAVAKSLGLIGDTWRHLRAKPWRIPLVFLCSCLVGSQLWLFTYGPMAGRALQVSLGYFLLPLVLVVVGRFLYKDQLSWWHWLAVGLASVGVVYETVRIGGFAWEALWVALLYPLYFVLRRAIGTSHLGGMFWEMTLLSPVALAYLLVVTPTDQALNDRPELWLLAPLIGLLGTAAFIVWILGSKYLPMSLFGLLSYIEPALLMLVAILLGEQVTSAEYPLYVLVWLAVLVIVAGGAMTALKQRKQNRSARRAGSTPQIVAEQQAPGEELVVPATGSIPVIATPETR